MKYRVHKERGNRWAIYVKGVNIYCDKSHQTFYSKEHAEATLIQILGEIKQGIFDPDFYSKRRKSIYSFSAYVDQWLKNFQKIVKAGKRSPWTLKKYRSYIENEFKPFFKDISLLDILPLHLKEYYLSIINFHPKTIYNKLGCLHKLLADAKDDGLIQIMIEGKMFESSRYVSIWFFANAQIQFLSLMYFALKNGFYMSKFSL